MDGQRHESGANPTRPTIGDETHNAPNASIGTLKHIVRLEGIFSCAKLGRAAVVVATHDRGDKIICLYRGNFLVTMFDKRFALQESLIEKNLGITSSSRANATHF
jgi:hypothetical protein